MLGGWRLGSIPSGSTKFGLKVFMDAHQPVTLKEGDRYPLGPPNKVDILEIECILVEYSGVAQR